MHTPPPEHVNLAQDRAEIENLLARACELADAGDYVNYAELFRHGRMVAPDGSVREGPEPILRAHEGHPRLYDGSPRTSHVNSNLRIEVAPDGMTASARSYITVFQGTDELPLQAIYAGRYLDELRKIDGRWWFSERRAVPSVVGDMSAYNGKG